MGWIDDSGEHELHALCVFADGKAGSTTSNRGIEVDTAADGRLLDPEQREWRQPDDVVGWLVCCDCRTGGAWRATTIVLARWQRVLPPEAEDIASGRVAAEGRWAPTDLLMADRNDVDDAAQRLWDAHRTPGLAIGAIEAASQSLDEAIKQLDDAVRTGRSAGLSWADVGRATGITRQSARERWGRTET